MPWMPLLVRVVMFSVVSLNTASISRRAAEVVPVVDFEVRVVLSLNREGAKGQATGCWLRIRCFGGEEKSSS